MKALPLAVNWSLSHLQGQRCRAEQRLEAGRHALLDSAHARQDSDQYSTAGTNYPPSVLPNMPAAASAAPSLLLPQFQTTPLLTFRG